MLKEPKGHFWQTHAIEAFCRTLVGNMGSQATIYLVTGDWMPHFAASVTEATRKISEFQTRGQFQTSPVLGIDAPT
jgi:hypothetical protein